MKVLPCWLISHAELPDVVLFRITDPRVIPAGADRITIDGKHFHVKGVSRWYEDAGLKAEAYEAENFLKEIKRKLHYDSPDKEDIERKLSECHYYRYQDVLIEPVMQRVK